MSLGAPSHVEVRPDLRAVRAAHGPADALAPVARLLFTLIFLMSAPGLLGPGLVPYAAQHGVPFAAILVRIAGVLALLGGLSVLAGYRARQGAWMLVLFLAVVTPTMHAFWAEKNPMMVQFQQVNFMKNLSMLGGALLITRLGAGPWSLDALLSSRRLRGGGATA